MSVPLNQLILGSWQVFPWLNQFSPALPQLEFVYSTKHCTNCVRIKVIIYLFFAFCFLPESFVVIGQFSPIRK